MKSISVIGLGNIGLPVLKELIAKGDNINLTGVDISQ